MDSYLIMNNYQFNYIILFLLFFNFNYYFSMRNLQVAYLNLMSPNF